MEHRILMVWRHHNETSTQAVDHAMHLLDEWRTTPHIQSRSAANMLFNQQVESNSNSNNWVKPTPGRYKCNVDASFFETLNKVGIEI